MVFTCKVEKSKKSGADVAGVVAGDVDKSERYGDKSEMADEEVHERAARAPLACVRWYYVVARSWLHTRRLGQATCMLTLSQINRRCVCVCHKQPHAPSRFALTKTLRLPVPARTEPRLPHRRALRPLNGASLRPWLAAQSEC
jgi:hypothetical protein